MSVKERLADLYKQKAAWAVAEQEAKRNAEQEHSLAYWERYNAEVESVRTIHAHLLEELRDKGVVSLVEEAVDHPVLPLRAVKDGAYTEWIAAEPSQEEIDKEYKAAKNRLGHGPYMGWQAEVLGPDLSRETLLWDESLKIRIFQEHFRHHSLVVSYVSEAVVEFSQDKQLKISGEKQTYSGTLPTDLIIVEEAIAQAMFKPAAVGERSPQLPFNPWPSRIRLGAA